MIFNCKPTPSLVAPLPTPAATFAMNPSSASASHSVTRRRILGWGSAGAIGGITAYLGWPRRESATVTTVKLSAPQLAAAAPELQPSASPTAASGIRREDFLPYLKSTFQLDSGKRCTLVEVSAALETAGAAASFTSFSLLFATPVASPAESRIHQLSHPQMGTLDLFISPVGQSEEHVYLEAICSQRV